MVENMGYGRERLKDIVEKEAEEEQKKQEEDVDLTLYEHERALKGAYRSFVRQILIVILIKPNHTSRR